MPLADNTAVANLALSHVGEPFLADYDTDTGTTAAAVRLHLPQCVETVLEGHVWSFATRCSQLTSAPVTETFAELLIGSEAGNTAIYLTARTSGPSGNEISIILSDTEPVNSLVDVQGTTITIHKKKARMIVSGTSVPDMNGPLLFSGRAGGFSFWSSIGEAYEEPGVAVPNANSIYILGNRELSKIGDVGSEGLWISNTPGASADLSTDWGPDGSETGTVTITAAVATAEQIIDAINVHPAASLLVTAAGYGDSDGSGTVSTLAETNFSGGSSTSTVYAPAYGSAFNLPADCLRVIKIDGMDIDVPRNEWEIQGRYVLLEEAQAEAPVVHYITNAPPVDEWPTTFTDAVAFLLAARLATAVFNDQNLSGSFQQRHELALGKARSKDTRETRSKENHGPRILAARSGLVNARFRRDSLPPYA